MPRNLLRSGLLAAAASMILATGASAADAPRRGALPSQDCFSTRDWRGWSSPSPDVLYLKVRNRDVYRVDLLGRQGPRLDSAGSFLVSEPRGSTRVCGPIDLDLKIADDLGFSMPLFPTAITKLTPEEVAALPPRHRP
jgi:hypothetical protein